MPDVDHTLYIDLNRQQLSLCREGLPNWTAPISSARNGPGQREGSGCTPTGLHRIRSLLGRGETAGRIFRSRQKTRKCWPTQTDADQEDLILSRILRLEGLELGHNRGGQIDTWKRYIYIHGTNHEDRIGEAVSAGCIRMRNRDIMQLADEFIEPGTLCLIEPRVPNA